MVFYLLLPRTFTFILDIGGVEKGKSNFGGLELERETFTDKILIASKIVHESFITEGRDVTIVCSELEVSVLFLFVEAKNQQNFSALVL